MRHNRIFSFLLVLCLLFSMLPPAAHAAHLEELDTAMHARQQWEATRQVRSDHQGNFCISPKAQAVLPAGEEEYIVSGVLGDVCQWGIADDGYLYIWCDGPMPTCATAEDYPWAAYKDLFGGLVVSAGSVADYAFTNCDNLYYVYLEANVASIGEQAFTSCNMLQEFWFYGSAPTIAGNAFTGVETDMIYHLGDTSFEGVADRNYGGTLYWYTWVEAIDSGMFDTVEWSVYEDMSLRLYGTGSPMQNLSAPENYPWHSYVADVTAIYIEQVSVIGDYAFMGCRNVTDLYCEAGRVGAYAFAGIGVEFLSLDYLTYLGEGAFAGAPALESVQFPAGTLEIGANAFADCALLAYIDFLGSPPIIGENAFKNVTATAFHHKGNRDWTDSHRQNYGGTLTWEAYASTLGEGDYEGIHWLVNDAGELYLTADGKALPDLDTPEALPWYSLRSEVRYLYTEGITHIGRNCFQGYHMLEYICFDGLLSSLGDRSFDDCTYLKEVSFAGAPPTVGEASFPALDYAIVHPGTPEWTQEAIDRIREGQRSGGENELPPVDIPPEVPEYSCLMSAQQVYDAMIALKPQYPEGMHWTNDDYYAWNGGYFLGGYGCAGFAFILSDAAFGTLPSRLIEEDISIEDVRVGDILRINNNTHSVIVLEVHEDHVVIAEGNYNSSIHWGRTLSAATVASTTDYIMTRYPEHSWSSNSCLEPRTCSVCSLQEAAPGHSWLDASCTTPKTCKVCGITEGAPAGHNWLDATCAAPQTCSRCGQTQGKPTGQHVFTDDADTACDVCGYIRNTEDVPPVQTAAPLSEYEMEVLRLTNLERVNAGLLPLTATVALQTATDIRADEVLRYFSHTRPDGTRCFTVLDQVGIDAMAMAENIAKGQRSPASVVTAWMNSDGHRKNILDSAYGHMGVGELSLAWVQLFTNAPAYTAIRVEIPEGTVFKPGTAIDDMGLVAVLRNANGDCWLPLAGSYCTGYDPNLPGQQTVTVSVLGVICTFTVTLEAATHVHTWKEATCEEPKTCTECGKAEGAPLGHNWKDATCEAPKTCANCGKTEGNALEHSWKDATCEVPKTCANCGKTEGTALGHSWKDATCEVPKTCANCGKTEGTALGHNWKDATCEVPKTCATCGKTEGTALGHNWKDAACETPKTCTVCGKTEGKALGHSWSSASCEVPGTCTRCGKTTGTASGHEWKDATCETPKTCANCGKTDGDALGHSWKDATCEAPKTCVNCGKTEGSALGHSWDGGTVTLEPTPDAPGEKTYTCSRCRTVRTEPIPQLLKQLIKVDAVDPLKGKAKAFSAENGKATTLDYKVSTNGATVLIFFSHICGNSQALMQQLNQCDWMANPWLNVVAVESKSGSDQAVRDFRDTYTPDVAEHIEYLYTQSNNAAFDYFHQFASGSTLTWPLVLVITGSAEGPMIRYGASGLTDTNELLTALAAVSEGFAGWDGTVHTHTWTDATCEAPKTCAECGRTEGDALGHSWEAAHCDTPKTCSACGITEGDALGHSFRDGVCIRCGLPEVLQGDANGDTRITYQDAMLVLRCSIGLEQLDDSIRAACDVNGNGKLDYQDAMMILRFSIGLITEFPVKK